MKKNRLIIRVRFNILVVFKKVCIFSCSKDKQMIIDNKWEVESIKVHADSAIQYPSIENIYKLSFRNKKEYNMLLRC